VKIYIKIWRKELFSWKSMPEPKRNFWQKSKTFALAVNNLRKIYEPSGKTGIIKSTSMKRTIFVGQRKEMESGQRLRKHYRLQESGVIITEVELGETKTQLKDVSFKLLLAEAEETDCSGNP
jgi:hypothetical protein